MLGRLLFFFFKIFNNSKYKELEFEVYKIYVRIRKEKQFAEKMKFIQKSLKYALKHYNDITARLTNHALLSLLTLPMNNQKITSRRMFYKNESSQLLKYIINV